jgi:rhodanese-related sulfurtransferase
VDGSMTGARFITPAELEILMSQAEEGELDLLDVRSRSEFRSGHISHAVSMPVEELENRYGELAHGKKLVIYCRTGRRCMKVLPLLAEKGFRDVLILEGGLEHWSGSLVTEPSP